MASDRRPGNLAHLERVLNAWSRESTETQATTGRLRRLVAISVLATMLDGLNHDGDTRLAFKGGASMEFRFGAAARASRDVDALAELGRAEANSFELLDEVANAIDMDKVQLGPNSDVTVLNVHYQIAQKLHACADVPADGTNPRVHDLYDILLLAGLAENIGPARIRAACEDTFAHRNKHAWPPVLPEWEDWNLIWDALDVPDDVRYPYQQAREHVERLVRAIAFA
jgi:hypothetical protein